MEAKVVTTLPQYLPPTGFLELFDAFFNFDTKINTAQQLQDQHSGALQLLGLRLDPNEIRPSFEVSNRNVFLAFLGALTPEMVQFNKFQVSLGVIAENLADKYRKVFINGGPSDDELDLVIAAGSIVDQYRHLGLEGYIEKLALYAGSSKTGVLPKLLEAETKGLFTPVGLGFAPGDMKHTQTVFEIQRLWKEAFEFTDSLASIPNAEDLRLKIFRHLESLVLHAKEHASTKLPSEREIDREMKMEMLACLRNAHRRLLEHAIDSVHIDLDDISSLKDPLLTLQRAIDATSVVSGNIFYRELSESGSVGILIKHKGTSQLIGFVCAREPNARAESEITCLGVDVRFSETGLEVFMLRKISDILRHLGKPPEAIRVLAITEELEAEFKRTFGELVVNKVPAYGRDCKVFRIPITNPSTT